MQQRRVLAEHEGLRITHDYEDALLEWDGGEVALADHYGDPQCALIDATRGWCVVGGEGLTILRLPGSLIPPDAQRFRAADRAELWRRGAPPPDAARCWFVNSLTALDADRITIRAETPTAERTFELDVRTLAWRPIG